MKKSFLIIFILLQAMKCILFAQTVSTPNGSSIEVNIYSAGDISELEDQAAYYIASRGWTTTGPNPDIIKTATATGAYNCHSYAWYMTEGGSTNYWMNAATKADYQLYYNPEPKNIRKYWEDGSYVEVQETLATKVFYGSCWTYTFGVGYRDSCDHSAIRITSGPNAGKYESKWGAWPRYIHPWDKSPYNTGNRKYYRIKPTISGSSSVCSVKETFIAENFPDTVTWTCSSNLKINTINGDTVIVTPLNYLDKPPILSPQTPPDYQDEFSHENTGNNSRAFKPLCPESTGWVKASVAGGISVKKNITANVVCLSNMATYTSYTGYGNMLYIIYMPPSLPTPFSTSWSASSNNIWLQGCDALACTFEIDKNLVGSQYIKLTATNVCGSYTATFNFEPSSMLSPPAPTLPSVSVYPNPATGILTIEIDAAAVDAQSIQSSFGTNNNPAPTYDIRLYDALGNLLRQQSTKGAAVQFNISNLPNGIYYLHVYDGVNPTPEMQQIVIEH